MGDDPGQQTTRAQLEMTLDVMAHSLVYWVQELHARGLLGEGSRVFAMTSSGGTRVMPFYGAVSAAKAALESHVRQLALELGRARVAVNAIRAGVTDTPASRKIPVADILFAGGATAESRRPPDRPRGRGGRDRRPVAPGSGLDQRERDRRRRRRGRDCVTPVCEQSERRVPLALTPRTNR